MCVFCYMDIFIYICLNNNFMIKRIAFVLFWVVCFSIYLYVEYTYQIAYEKRRKQQDVEHNFYEQYKDSIKQNTSN